MVATPSPAALRVLRQLAYVGSGTIAAVGVLLTEERRRRICTARRIIENKRKIQACDKWVGNRTVGTAAGAAQVTYSPEDTFNGYSPDWQQSEQRDGKFGGKRQWTAEENAVKADFLPSQVERNYQRAIETRPGLTRRHSPNVQAREWNKADNQNNWKSPDTSNNGLGAQQKSPPRKLNSRTPLGEVAFHEPKPSEIAWETPVKQYPDRSPSLKPKRHAHSTENNDDSVLEVGDSTIAATPQKVLFQAYREKEVASSLRTGDLHSSLTQDGNDKRNHELGTISDKSDGTPDKLAELRGSVRFSRSKRSVGSKSGKDDSSGFETSDILFNQVSNVAKQQNPRKIGEPKRDVDTLFSPAPQDGRVNVDDRHPLFLGDASNESSASPKTYSKENTSAPSHDIPGAEHARFNRNASLRISTMDVNRELSPNPARSVRLEGSAHPFHNDITAAATGLASSEMHEQHFISMPSGPGYHQAQSGEDQLDQMLRETENHSFGVANCSQLLNDEQFYRETSQKLSNLPNGQTELLEGAKFPFGGAQFSAWQLEDLVMAKKVAYYVAYQACSGLLRRHRDHEAVDLFIRTLGQHRKWAKWAIGTVELPMRMPARWATRGYLLQLLRASMSTGISSSTPILFELAVSYHGQDATLGAIQMCIHDLIAEKRLEEAAEALSSVPEMDRKSATVAERCVEISFEVINAAFAHDRLQAAMKIFEWTEKQDLPNKKERLEPIIRACLELCTGSNAPSDDLSPEKQVEPFSRTHPILWAVSASCGLPYMAIALVQHFIHECPHWMLKEDLVLACNAVLSRVWRETSNFRLLQGFYEDLRLSAKAHGGLPVSTSNCWLMICYKSGHKDEAQECLQYMQSSDGPGADILSFGHMMRDQASEGRWPAVEAMLVRLHESGQMASFSRICYLTISDVIREFMKNRGLERGLDFITKAVNDYGLEPSVRLSNVFIVQCVRERKWSMIASWYRWLNELHVKFRVNPLSVLHMMDCFLLEFRPERRLFIRMCYALRGTRKGLVTSQLWRKTSQAIAFDARKRLSRLDSPDSPIGPRWNSHVEAPLAKLEQDLKSLPSLWHIVPNDFGLLKSDPAEQSSSEGPPEIWSKSGISTSLLDHKMILAISLRRPAEAVQLFLETLSSAGLQHSDYSLSIAVDASLRANDGYPEPARHLLQEAEAAGMDITGGSQHFLLQRLRMHRGMHSRHGLTQIVLEFYKSLAAVGQYSRHHLCVAAAEHLIFTGRAEGGIELLKLILMSTYSERIPMGIVAMTTFLKGYAALGHLQGIKWVVDKVLEEDMSIDAKFCHELGEARKPLRVLFERPGLSEESKHQVEDAIAHLNEWRSECIQRREQQTMRTESDGWELVKTIQELSTEFESYDDEAEDDLEILENGELMRRYSGVEGPFTENATRLAYGPVRPAKARTMLKEPLLESNQM